MWPPYASIKHTDPRMLKCIRPAVWGLQHFLIYFRHKALLVINVPRDIIIPVTQQYVKREFSFSPSHLGPNSDF